MVRRQYTKLHRKVPFFQNFKQCLTITFCLKVSQEYLHHTNRKSNYLKASLPSFLSTRKRLRVHHTIQKTYDSTYDS